MQGWFVGLGLSGLSTLSAASGGDHIPPGTLGRWFEHDSGSWSRELGLQVKGWLNLGVTYNPEQPEDHYNGPVSFSDRANELQLNQLYLYVERKASVSTRDWQWGGRMDFVFGTDAVFTRSLGDPGEHWDAKLLNERIYGIAFPQAYLEVTSPARHGFKFKLGEFYTVVGNESVMAPDNFFYSHAYTMQFGEPFSHTGLMVEYQATDDLVVKAAAVTGSRQGGWDGGFQYGLNNWAFVGALQWTPAERNYNLLLSGTHGHLRGSGDQDINLYSAVLHYDFSARWHGILQFDQGWLTSGRQSSSAEWHGLVGYVTYDLLERLAAGVRLEWFRDDDGARVTTSAREPFVTLPAASYYGITLGLNWKPSVHIVLRPNVRFDFSDGSNAFDAGTANEQWLFSLDALLVTR